MVAKTLSNCRQNIRKGNTMINIAEKTAESGDAGLRAWWANIATAEQLGEALCFARGLLEEVVLAGKKAKIEIHIERKLNTS